MKQKYLGYLIILLAVAVIVPQVALAAWWNPMSWGWLNSIFHFQQTGQQSQKQIQQQAPKIDTSGWKTYTNTQYGFEIKYPADWGITYNTNNYGTTNIKDVNFSKPSSDNLTNVTVAFGSGSGDVFNGYCGSSLKKINIGGKETDFCDNIAANNTEGWMPTKKDFEDSGIAISAYADKPYSSNKSVVLEILSTFKFTNNSPVVGGDKDVHGCIGSAGYTWCEAKQKCIRSWEEPCSPTQSTKIKIIAPIPLDSIDLKNNRIDAKISPSKKTIRIVVSQGTKFSSTCQDKIANFQDFYFLNSKWIGPGWLFDVSGIKSDDGSVIFANEISCTAQ